MGLNINPLSHAGYPPGATGTPSTMPSQVRAATATEATAGTLNSVYISPSTLAASAVPGVSTAGASPRTANGRNARAIFSSVSIAAGATQSFVISNNKITGSSTVVRVSMFGATTGAALNIQSVTPAAGQVTIVVENGTGATTSTANITFDISVLT